MDNQKIKRQRLDDTHVQSGDEHSQSPWPPVIPNQNSMLLTVPFHAPENAAFSMNMRSTNQQDICLFEPFMPYGMAVMPLQNQFGVTHPTCLTPPYGRPLDVSAQNRINGVTDQLTELPYSQLQLSYDPQQVSNALKSLSTTHCDDTPLMCLPTTESDLVCFGRIIAIEGKWEQQMLEKSPTERFCVELLPSCKFRHADSTEIRGRIQPDIGSIIHGLMEETTLKLHSSCLVKEGLSSKVQGRAGILLPCELDVTVYGPLKILEELSSWLEECEIFLQDPIECHHDVVYMNPQKMASEGILSCPLVSQVVSQSRNHTDIQSLPESPDWLDILSTHACLVEAEQPLAIRTDLKGHQKQALTFMLQRERGWSFDKSNSDMWELVEEYQERFFLNRISEIHQQDEPANFSGGIIADPMGLGKTLTMIALTATDLVSYEKEPVHADHNEEDKSSVPATLIIIPPPLIGSWEEQLSQHVVAGTLVYRRHHGKSKLNSIDDIRGVHIVLTSYNTVSSEWKSGNGQESKQSVLFSVKWRRIILDEAHFIRNGNSQMAKAACSLDAISRWAVTGTPIQNRLTDLAALLSFVRAYPYTDPRVFNEDISLLWKSGEDEKAANRLKILSSYLLLRRPKATIELPPRTDTKCQVNLYPAEREYYNQIRQQALVGIDEALRRDSEMSHATIYANALQKIESLRLICDLGLHYRKREEQKKRVRVPEHSADTGNWASKAQRIFNARRDLVPFVCSQCASVLDSTDSLLDDSGSGKEDLALLSECHRFICRDCAKKLRLEKRSFACGHQPSCPTAPISTSNVIMEETPDIVLNGGLCLNDQFPLPSKVEALLHDLKNQPPGTKSIVFSTWRLTLDVIEKGLEMISIQSVRFDGKVPQKDRQNVVERFRRDPSVGVMLLTLSCGAVGLNLTIATRAYLMEPHWNPTVEEQALARIHRLGQTKDVTTVRFVVRDSFEEQVIKLQDSKKHLAGILLSHHDSSHSEDNLENLHKLRSLL